METLQRSQQLQSPESSKLEAKQLLTLLVCCLSISIIVIDFTIVNNALPSIQKTFAGVSVKDLEWITSLYGLLFGSFLLTWGKLGGRVWKKAHLGGRHCNLRRRVCNRRALSQPVTDAHRPINPGVRRSDGFTIN